MRLKLAQHAAIMSTGEKWAGEKKVLVCSFMWVYHCKYWSVVAHQYGHLTSERKYVTTKQTTKHFTDWHDISSTNNTIPRLVLLCLWVASASDGTPTFPSVTVWCISHAKLNKTQLDCLTAKQLKIIFKYNCKQQLYEYCVDVQNYQILL